MRQSKIKFSEPVEEVATPLDSQQREDVEQTPLNLQKMITRDKVAEYLKVSIQSVINYTNRGLLVAHKIGRRVLYNEDQVIAALQSCAVKRYQHESTRLYIFKQESNG